MESKPLQEIRYSVRPVTIRMIRMKKIVMEGIRF